MKRTSWRRYWFLSFFSSNFLQFYNWKSQEICLKSVTMFISIKTILPASLLCLLSANFVVSSVPIESDKTLKATQFFEKYVLQNTPVILPKLLEEMSPKLDLTTTGLSRDYLYNQLYMHISLIPKKLQICSFSTYLFFVFIFQRKMKSIVSHLHLRHNWTETLYKLQVNNFSSL